MKVVESVLERRFCKIVIANEMEFTFMSETGTIDIVLILRSLQEG